MQSTKSVIRTIYLYLFALVGLFLTAIGTIMMVNLLLKTYVFKNADGNYRNYSYISQPLMMDEKMTEIYKPLNNTKETIEDLKDSKIELTDSQKETLDIWLDDYKKWSDSEKARQEMESKRDYAKESRERDMSQALAMIIVGFPLYLIHWAIIARDIKRNKEFND